jgi:hypothetical protein
LGLYDVRRQSTLPAELGGNGRGQVSQVSCRADALFDEGSFEVVAIGVRGGRFGHLSGQGQDSGC